MSTLRRLESRKGDDGHEAYVSAECTPPEEDAWLPRADEHEGRAQGAEATTSKGAQTPDRLTGRLPRSERLTTSAEFQALFHRGKRIERPSFLVLWRESESGRRVGFAVSRRLKRAVDRNRIRRRLREAYRAARSVAPEALAVILIGKKRILEVEFDVLVGELKNALASIVVTHSTAGTER